MTFARVAAGLVAVAGVAALAACSSTTSGTGTGSVPAASTVSSASSSAASSSPAKSSTATSSIPAGPADCTSSQIKVTAIDPPGGGAAGHRGVVLLFTNISGTSCTLGGYPGVDGLNSAGTKQASATRTLSGMIGFCGCTTPASLTLAPGTVASAVTEGVADGSGPCAVFPSLLVTPPNTATSTKVTLSPYSCGFTVHPVVSGQTGQFGPP